MTGGVHMYICHAIISACAVNVLSVLATSAQFAAQLPPELSKSICLPSRKCFARTVCSLHFSPSKQAGRAKPCFVRVCCFVTRCILHRKSLSQVETGLPWLAVM